MIEISESLLKPKMLIVTIYNRLFKKKIRVQNLKICLQNFRIKILCKPLKWKSRAEFHFKQNHISKIVIAIPIRELPDWPLKLFVLLIFWLWYIFLMTCIKSVANTLIIMRFNNKINYNKIKGPVPYLWNRLEANVFSKS